MRRVGIVGVARKLAIALWRYLQYGEIPAGPRLSRPRPEVAATLVQHMVTWERIIMIKGRRAREVNGSLRDRLLRWGASVIGFASALRAHAA
jgi:hypothetical protein